MKQLFLDTNYFLHYPPPDAIDWCKLTGAQNVLLIVAPTVVRELNEKKDGKDATKVIQERAKQRLSYLLPKIKGGMKTPLRPNTEITAVTSDPTIDFPAYKLNDRLPDDWLLATMIEYRQSNTSSDLALVTEDGGLVLKAPAHNIEVVDPPLDQRLEDKPDPVQKENQQLKQELAQIKAARPNIELQFADGKRFTKLAAPIAEHQKIAEEESQWKADYKEHCAKERAHNVFAKRPSILLTQLNVRYDDELVDYRDLILRTYQVDLQVANSGKVPADGIDITLVFPPNVSVSTERPARPSPTQGTFGIGKMPSIGPFIEPFCQTRISNNTVQVHLKSAKHHHNTLIDPVFLTFESSPFAFGIDFRMGANNIHDPLTGTIHVRI